MHLGLQNVLNNVQKRPLPELNEAIEYLERVNVGNHVRKEAQKWVGQECFKHDLSRLKVDIKEALRVKEPLLDILDEGIKLAHALSVAKTPLWLHRESQRILHVQWQA